MKDLSQYPVTFPYGATDGIFYGPNGSIGPYHRGDDRACPVGTPVIVNGVQIGLTGNTGASSGAHCHIGCFVDSKDVNPKGQGFTLPDAHVYDTGYDDTNGNYVRLYSNGQLWVYLHLSQIDVIKNQAIQGDSNMDLEKAQEVASDRHDQLNELWQACGVDPSKVTDEHAATAQAIANVDAKNKQIAAGAVTRSTALKYVQDNLQ